MLAFLCIVKLTTHYYLKEKVFLSSHIRYINSQNHLFHLFQLISFTYIILFALRSRIVYVLARKNRVRMNAQWRCKDSGADNADFNIHSVAFDIFVTCKHYHAVDVKTWEFLKSVNIFNSGKIVRRSTNDAFISNGCGFGKFLCTILKLRQTVHFI